MHVWDVNFLVESVPVYSPKRDLILYGMVGGLLLILLAVLVACCKLYTINIHNIVAYYYRTLREIKIDKTII